MNDNLTAVKANATTLSNQAKDVVEDAANAVAAPVADKVKELQKDGYAAIDKAADTYHDVQERTVKAGARAAVATDAFVQENPWRSTFIAGVIGVLAGVIITRR